MLTAITLDLDDTLWPLRPVLERAEQALARWFAASAPAVLAAYPTRESMWALRTEVAAAMPGGAHDVTRIRRATIAAALARSGADAALADEAMDVFLAERNAVTPFPDALPALERIARRYPVAAVSNGNADLARIGIAHLFRFSHSAADAGVGKPDAAIFLTAVARLGARPAEVLHVGDDPDLDVLGARRAGLASAWINRRAEAWDRDEAPDQAFGDLEALASWLGV
ncbi:MAG: HAD family hydrolase [Burkholderiales bacterium]|jgi:putative hydrolase of the HAD superfamily|nr:HAD family hydrolase [Burkholderiales bacterium]